MAGLFIMIAGAILLLLGALIFFKKDKTVNKASEATIENAIKIAISEGVLTRNEKDKTVNKASEATIENAIKIAISDGVLTRNEKEALTELAKNHDLNPMSVIETAEKRRNELTNKPETEIIDPNKRSGDEFEEFVIKKFNRKYFAYKQWAGDKYIDGHYSETTLHPDLTLELNLGNNKYNLAVECKWRKNLYKGGVEVASFQQINRYKEFAKEKGMPVFIALGLGNEASNPEELFIIPLNALNNNFISRKELEKYKRLLKTDFFYDVNEGILK